KVSAGERHPASPLTRSWRETSRYHGQTIRVNDVDIAWRRSDRARYGAVLTSSAPPGNEPGTSVPSLPIDHRRPRGGPGSVNARPTIAWSGQSVWRTSPDEPDAGAEQ